MAPASKALLAGAENRLTLSSIANREADGRIEIMAPQGWQIPAPQYKPQAHGPKTTVKLPNVAL